MSLLIGVTAAQEAVDGRPHRGGRDRIGTRTGWCTEYTIPTVSPVTRENHLSRRTLLLGLAATPAAVWLAGCSSDGSNSPAGSGGSGGGQLAGRDRPASPHLFEFDFLVDLEALGDDRVVGDLRRGTDPATHLMQVGLLLRERLPGFLELYRDADLDQPLAPEGEAVTVNGAPGVLVTGDTGVPGLPDDASGEGVFWQIAPGTWLNALDLGDRADNGARIPELSLRLAEAVRVERSAPMRVPYQLATLPSGLAVVGGRMHATAPRDDTEPVSFRSSVTLRDVDGLTAQIDARPANAFPELDALPDSPIGEPVVRARDAVVRFESFAVVVGRGDDEQPAPGVPVARPELLGEIASAIGQASDDLTNPATWLEPWVALPA